MHRFLMCDETGSQVLNQFVLYQTGMGKALIFMENEGNHLRFSTFCYRVFAALSTAKKGHYSPYILP